MFSSFFRLLVSSEGCTQLQCGRKVKGRCGVLNIERKRCLPACGPSLPFWVFRAPRGLPITVKVSITGDYLGDRILVRDGQFHQSRRIAKCIAGGGHCPPVLRPTGRFVRIEIRPKNKTRRCFPFTPVPKIKGPGYVLSISVATPRNLKWYIGESDIGVY